MQITSEHMQHIRKVKGWSQARFAQALDVSQPTICNWEKSPPQRGPAKKLIEALVRATGGYDGDGSD